MSKYKTIQTEYRNLASLKQALCDVLSDESAFEVARDPKTPCLPLFDWHGLQRPERASLRIPRQIVNRYSSGASNDVGFAWDGRCYQAIVSEYDQGKYGCADLLRQIRQRYALHEVRRQAKAKGYTVREAPQPDGSILITLNHR